MSRWEPRSTHDGLSIDDKRNVEMTNHSDFKHQANKPKTTIHTSGNYNLYTPSPPVPITLHSSHQQDMPLFPMPSNPQLPLANRLPAGH